MILDIGPKSIAAVNALDRHGRDAGLERTARRLRDAAVRRGDASPPRATPPSAPSRASSLSVAGGGETVAALNHAGAADGFSFVSTAGGAFLEWLEGKALPGVEVLRRTSLTRRIPACDNGRPFVYKTPPKLAAL